MQDSVNQIVEAIENADFREFWWDNPLLSQASKTPDPRVVRSLAFRHHCLGNKDAFSAHVVRRAIFLCDGAEFPNLWKIIDAEHDADAIRERMDDPTFLPWAAAYILGEIGGAPAFREAVLRLAPSHSVRHFLLVRLLSHLVVRYLAITAEEEPQVTMIDLKTGESERLLSRYVSRQNFEMTRRKRAEANELFTPLSSDSVQEARARIELMPDAVLNLSKEQFRVAFSRLPIRKG